MTKELSVEAIYSGNLTAAAAAAVLTDTITERRDLAKDTDNRVRLEPSPSSPSSDKETSSSSTGGEAVVVQTVSYIDKEPFSTTAANNVAFNNLEISSGIDGEQEHPAQQFDSSAISPHSPTPPVVSSPVRLILTPINRVKYMS